MISEPIHDILKVCAGGRLRWTALNVPGLGICKFRQL